MIAGNWTGKANDKRGVALPVAHRRPVLRHAIRMDYAAGVLVFPERATFALLVGFVATVSAAAAVLPKLSTDVVRISCWACSQ